MAQEQQAVQQEESMEDILHSIRDIIEDEGKQKSESEGSEAVEDDDILELTDVTEPRAEEPAAVEVVAEQQIQEVVSNDPEPVSQPRDILEDLDAVLSDDEAANQISAANIVPPVIEPEEIKPVQQAPIAKPAIPKNNAVNTPAGGDNLNTILTKSVAQATSEHLKGLLSSIPKPDVDSPPFRAGHTLEDLVVETMKPMLAEWLNANLPIIVKDIVEREVRRLIPRE